MTKYEKLVRDKIPQIIEASGERPITRILQENEYRLLLEAKLDEEVGEFHRDQNMEELADILEVVYALAEIHGGKAELHRICEEKRAARGGFAEHIYLIGKD